MEPRSRLKERSYFFFFVVFLVVFLAAAFFFAIAMSPPFTKTNVKVENLRVNGVLRLARKLCEEAVGLFVVGRSLFAVSC